MSKYIVYPGNNSKVFIVPALEERGNWEEASQAEASALRVHFIWKPTVFPITTYAKLEALQGTGFAPQIHNHLENNRCITTKPGLVRTLKQFYGDCEDAMQAGLSVHDVIATSFIITAQVEDLEFRQFVARYYEIKAGHFSKERVPAKHCKENIWLLKPAALNQGRGIEVCRSIQEIRDSLRAKPVHSIWVLQKYIERPLLLHKRKFDIRIWALATASFEFYYYKEGYLRTSSHAYNTDAHDNYVHLTNNCLQKFGDQYGMFEEGNTLSFDDFQRYLDNDYSHLGIQFRTDLLPRMKDLMIDTYKAGMNQMHNGKRNLSFELLGFDFLIDEDFRVWLIEVNTNPYLGTPNEFIEKLLPVMIDDLLAITVDAHIPPKYPRSRTENGFELLYRRSVGKSVNMRNPYTLPFYPVASLAQSNIPATPAPKDEENAKNEGKAAQKDTTGMIKDMIESSLVIDLHDFAKLAGRLLNQLKNWEIYSEEQIKSSFEGLKLMVNHLGAYFLVRFNFCTMIYSFIGSENTPRFMLESLLDILRMSLTDVKFRREMVVLGICEVLIDLFTNELSDARIKKLSLKALLVICSHPARKIYIPGETREFDWIRSTVISKGVLLFLLQNQNSPYRGMIMPALNNEFDHSDYESLLKFIKTCKGNPEESQFPECLKDKILLNEIEEHIRPICQKQREEAQEKKEKEKIRQKEAEEEAVNLQKEKMRIREEKQRRVMEYANKRYLELKQQKIKENSKIEKIIETPEFRKQKIMEKAKKLEQERLVQSLKIKRQKEILKKKQEEMLIKQQELREKAVQDWLKNKLVQEKDRKMQEKIAEIERQKALEYHIYLRKLEFEKKLIDRKLKIGRQKLMRSESEIKIHNEESYEYKPASTNIVDDTNKERKKKIKTWTLKKSDFNEKMLEGIRSGIYPGKPYLESQKIKRMKKLI